MNNWTITFEPLLPYWVIGVLAGIAAILAIYGLIRGLRGSLLRLIAWALLALALANPSLLQEDREPLKSVVAVIVDQTDSQKLDGRDLQTETARSSIKDLLKRFPQFEVREIIAKNGAASNSDASTALVDALKSGLQDVPPKRIAGAILLTDGQVHDVPKSGSELPIKAPIHTLLTGKSNDSDRRVVIRKAPRFGIVGESQEIVYEVKDTNIDSSDLVEIRVYIDGELSSVEQVQSGQESSFFFDVPHGGKTIIELRADVVEGEITPVNNQVFTVLEGIRENLRVLLVSGEPHAGERTWRNLLKSDASVDLVHFTILRPPEKQDGTPINQLSLIAFPTRELFIEKIDEFDLIIFDRYKRRGVLPVLYFDNIARYLTDGGAILVAAGPEHAGPASIHQTRLAPVMPIEPTGEITEAPFRPKISDAGRRHPVTRDLPGLQAIASKEEPKWSRWFRIIDGKNAQGDTIMEAEGKPLLVLNRPGKGRIAMLMSDHVWLWARGFEGGGPHTQLLRRLGHWLMKEPELDEEALRANAKGEVLRIERQTMGDDPGKLTLLTPDGKTVNLDFKDNGSGKFIAEHKADRLGLYRLANGDLTALAHVGPSNPREYAEVVSTDRLLAPIAKATGGLIKRVSATGTAASLPRIVPVRSAGAKSGDDWMGLVNTGATTLKGVIRLPLFAGLLGLAILLMALAGMWAREGR